MRKYILFLIVFIMIGRENCYSQTSIYKQDFSNGLPNGWTKTSDGWNIVVSNSSGYTDASGGNSLRAFYMVGSHSLFTSAVSTKNYKNITISWAEKRPYNFDLNVDFSCSLDRINWITIPYEKSSGDNTWQIINKSIPIILNDKFWDKDTVYFCWKYASAISFFNREMFIDDIHLTGISKLVSIEGETIKTDFKIYQNYPNPFNASTIINYSLPSDSEVKIKIYDSLGEVLKIFSYRLSAGHYTENLNMYNFASGIYFYSIEAVTSLGSRYHKEVKKMLLLK